jgi:hypothetical protein
MKTREFRRELARYCFFERLRTRERPGTLGPSGPGRNVRCMFDIPALEVAVGLIFLYIVLALLCTTINETISTAVGLRARYLQLGLLNLLSASSSKTDAGVATLKAFYAHPLVQGLVRPAHGPDPSLDPTSPTKWWRKPPYPSYVPSRTFVAALADIAEEAPTKLAHIEEDGEAVRARLDKAADNFEKTLAAIPNAPLSEALLALYRSTGREAAHFQHAVEQWFDDAMERVSGWYKRRVHLILFVIATFVIILLNADTLAAGRVLWRDDAVRSAVVKKADAVAAGKLTEVDLENQVKKLDLPLGWDLSFGNEPTQVPNDVLAWIAKLIGLAVTIGAVMLGAPFWFDLLSKVMRVRATGAPPPATDSVRAGEGDQRRAGPRSHG